MYDVKKSKSNKRFGKTFNIKKKIKLSNYEIKILCKTSFLISNQSSDMENIWIG